MKYSSIFFKFSAFFASVFIIFIFFSPAKTFAQTADQAAQRAEWEQELKDTQADIAKWQSVLDASKKNTASLQNDAAALQAKINQAQALIKQKNIEIAALDSAIADKNTTISNLEQKIENSKDSIADVMRQTNELDQYTLADVILSKQNLSDFFSDQDTYSSVNRSLESLLDQIRQSQNLTEKEKAELATQKDKQTDLVQAAQTQKNQVAADEKQKQNLIAANKSQEKSYQQVIAEEQAKAAQIEAKLFSLAGGSAAIPFGTALTYAQTAGKQTNTDPAFILAILTQESNLGSNVGKCYLIDASTGAGVSTTGKTYPNVMKPTRDVPPFLDITKALGFDWTKTVVSCPIPSAGGYGGAMGPAQFIASTWQLLADRLQSALGHFANPWAAQDAFMASSMYLSDLGATGTSYTSEIKAACKYYGTGGSTCSYGKSVMSLVASIQSDIDYLNQYGVSRR